MIYCNLGKEYSIRTSYCVTYLVWETFFNPYSAIFIKNAARSVDVLNKVFNAFFKINYKKLSVPRDEGSNRRSYEKIWGIDNYFLIFNGSEHAEKAGTPKNLDGESRTIFDIFTGQFTAKISLKRALNRKFGVPRDEGSYCRSHEKICGIDNYFLIFNGSEHAEKTGTPKNVDQEKFTTFHFFPENWRLSHFGESQSRRFRRAWQNLGSSDDDTRNPKLSRFSYFFKVLLFLRFFWWNLLNFNVTVCCFMRMTWMNRADFISCLKAARSGSENKIHAVAAHALKYRKW